MSEHDISVMRHPGWQRSTTIFTSVFNLYNTSIIYSAWIFTQVLTVSFYWSPRDSKASHLSWSLLDILDDLNTTELYTVKIIPWISSSHTFSGFFGVVLRVGITVIFMFHRCFFSYLSRSRYLSSFLITVNFILWSAGATKTIFSL